MMQCMATIKLNEYEIGFTDQFFFDTNIWILLFGTVKESQANDENQYAILFEKIIAQNSPIYITSMITYEFASILLKRDFKQWKSNNNLINKKFKKDFVGSKEYENSVATITASINKIYQLPNLVILEDVFNPIDKDAILNNFKIVDFNNSYYDDLIVRSKYSLITSAILNKFKIVTNSKDFQQFDSNIDIITAKNRLI